MKIIGIEGLTASAVQAEVASGAKFVYYEYCISLLVITFRRSSDVYFIRADESAVTKGLGFSLLTLLLGWWGIPWGPIYTITSLVTNFGGGKNVTAQIMTAAATPTPNR